ncbi:hypothetical protein [Streptomyces capillispiralis]|uniref:Beta-lactamase family protein n=1 Tax=Streptomyces capillispiralis TaxID=68182 RepID=A0A561TRQ1_9ACTN|nr:hypothetical protein [Streptomyces capillispiralis]TWF89792.1 hypothetical protein FHX78_116835 [Streptomyces capillispiralis]GHH94117.1 hypothetical protein GCM10017779_45740 [Streptomyces capillispiralis]
MTKYTHACVRLEHEGRVLVHVPDQPVETLLVPAQGSWLKSAEAIDLVRAVRPRRAFLFHDARINERGLAGVVGRLSEEAGGGYRYLAPGEWA